ncbi:MAG: hypothetical protein JKY94_10910 [Rhodobacteraceae bacterium]|nr:hypothetical protein [Paracoccaceae bacterium]
MIIYAPSNAANASQGTTSGALVESIDITATCIEAQRGNSSAPYSRGLVITAVWSWQNTRQLAQFRHFRIQLFSQLNGQKARPCTKRCTHLHGRHTGWKLIHYEGGFRPMLFTWSRRTSQRTTISDTEILRRRNGKGSDRRGILIGVFSENDTAPENPMRYTGKAGSKGL